MSPSPSPSSRRDNVDEVEPIVEPTHHAFSHAPENGIEPKGQQINLNDNFEARIQNPLAGFGRVALLQAVDDFCREKGLEEYRATIRKGALVARDPTGYEDITGEEALDEVEINALRDEVLHKWRVTGSLLLTVVACSIGACIQGWDQTGSNGATVKFPEVFGIAGNTYGDKMLVGLVNAAPYISTALFGCWLSDPINDLVGRRGTIFISANFCLWPVFGSAFCQTWQQLLICRLLMGMGMGTKASTVPVYAAETSPAPIRGALVMGWQLWTAFGIFLGTCANLAVAEISAQAWRLQLGSAIIPAIPLLLLIYFCPESPRWYMKKNKYQDAMRSLLRLRNNPVQAGRDLYYIHVQLELGRQYMKQGNYISKFLELFTIPRVRRATLASFTVMIAQQLCGINVLAFYSTTLFKNSGATDFEALLASFGFGLVNFVFALPAIWTIDTFGRRSLLLFTFPQMIWTMVAAGLCTMIPGPGGLHLALVSFFIYLFAAFYSPGEGPVPFTYSAEVFPLSHREVGMAWAVATCLGWAAVVSITFPIMHARLGTMGVFFLYAFFNVVALVLIFLWLPESKQRTLEELDYIFAVPTRVFMKYQVTKTLPFWAKRYVMMDKTATVEPLYQLDSGFFLDGDDDAIEEDHYNDKSKVEMKHIARLPSARLAGAPHSDHGS